MHKKNIEYWQHNHFFNIEKKSEEKKTLIVVIITVVTMFIELFCGWFFNSMALFADGCHMSTHAFALSISLFAYIFARKLSEDTKFAFGTWKIEILGAYTSALFLGGVGIYVIYISIERIFNPLTIKYFYAILVTIIGLIVNVICAFILQHKHSGDHSHDLDSEHSHHHHHHSHTDLNLKSAYLHVIADAMTSVFAIIALVGAYYLNLIWLDPVMGIVGAMLIFRWSFSLIKETSSILLDREMNFILSDKIKEKIEADKDSKISDLHLWKVAQQKYACIISLVAYNPLSVEEYKEKLKSFEELAHTTVEINLCKKKVPTNI